MGKVYKDFDTRIKEKVALKDKVASP